MSKPRITFAQLRHLLLDMGFTETVTPKSHVFFAHQQSGAETALPIYRSNQVVMPHHLATVRIMLDYKGLMDGDAFDEFVASASVKQSASGTRLNVLGPRGSRIVGKFVRKEKSMKVHNPWIDPRIVQLGPAEAKD